MKTNISILRSSSRHLRFIFGWFFFIILLNNSHNAKANERIDSENEYKLLASEFQIQKSNPYCDSTETKHQLDSIHTLISLEQENFKPEEEAQQWIKLGEIYLAIRRYYTADSSFNNAAALLTDSDMAIKTQYEMEVANLYNKSGQYHKAKQYYQRAIKLFEIIKDKKGQSIAMHRLAQIEEKLGDYTAAIGLMHQTLEIYHDIDDNEGRALLNMDLGNMLQKWHKNQAAAKHYSQAYAYFNERNDLGKMIFIQIKLGQIALANNQYQQALVHFYDVIENDPKGTPPNVKGLIFINIGDVYQKTSDYHTALEYYTKAIAIFRTKENQIGYIQALQKQAESFLSLHYFNKADSVVRKSLTLATEIGLKEYQMNGWHILSEINNHQKNYHLAYICLKNATKLKDEIFSQEGNKLINELSVRFETDKITEAYQSLKEKNQKANTALKIQRDTGSYTIILSTFIILVALITIIFITVRTRESKKGYALLALKNKKISDQKEILTNLNLKLTQSREQYRSIVENASVGMYQTSPEGKVRFANASLKRMLRYPDNMDISEINLSTEQPKRHEFIQLIEEKGVITGREDIWKRYDGTHLDVNESAWRVQNTENGIHYYEGVVEDISKRKAAELALTESQQKLQSINKELIKKNAQIEKSKNEAVTANESKSIFLANVSHEIRTPMNSIIGFSEILAQRSHDEQELYYINAIKSSSSNLLALLNDILDLSKIQSNEIELIYEPISIKKIAEDIIKMFQLRCKQKNLKIILDFIKPFPEMIMMDGLRIRQVLTNLFGNALKFTDKGSIHLIFSGKLDHNNRYHLNIEIRDTGIGIAKEEFDTIFNAFKQSKFLGDKAYSGTGLGLSITKQLIEKMEGKISLESELNRGTTFFVSIPNLELAYTNPEKQPTNYPKFPDLNNSDNFRLILEESTDSTIPEMGNELQTKLLLSFGSEWIKLNKSHLVPELIDFSEHLKQFSETENIPWLEVYAKELFEACQRFDVDKIESLNRKLKNIFATQTQK